MRVAAERFRRPDRRPRIAAAALGPVVALSLAGCLGSTPTAAPLATLPDLVTPPAAVTYDIDQAAWIQGFVVTVQQAIADLDPKGGTVRVLLAVQNPGTEDSTLDAPMTLTAGDATFPSNAVQPPDVPAGATAELSVEFDVVARGSVDDAILVIGRPSDHAVAVPLRPDPSRLVTLQPTTSNIKGAYGVAGNLKVILRSVTLRWDLPDWYDELPLGTEALTVTYDVINQGSFGGGTSFTADNIELRLPDGTLLSPRQDGHSQSIALIGAHRTALKLFSRFEIPNELSGKFGLLVMDSGKSHLIPFPVGS